MKRTRWQVSLLAILGLVAVAAQSFALPAPNLPGCCLCSCGSGPDLCLPSGGLNCPSVCPPGLNDTCEGEFFNTTCPQTAECAGAIIPSAGAPLASSGGLTAMAMLLGGFGIWQAARRSRRSEGR